MCLLHDLACPYLPISTYTPSEACPLLLALPTAIPRLACIRGGQTVTVKAVLVFERSTLRISGECFRSSALSY